jgi:twitching motility protein PilT
VPLRVPPLTPVDTKTLCYSILTDAQKVRFEEDLELDLSFGVKNLARFRANIFMQRGAVAGAFRVIPFKILSFAELGLPPIVGELCRVHEDWCWSRGRQDRVNRPRWPR